MFMFACVLLGEGWAYIECALPLYCLVMGLNYKVNDRDYYNEKRSPIMANLRGVTSTTLMPCNSDSSFMSELYATRRLLCPSTGLARMLVSCSEYHRFSEGCLGVIQKPVILTSLGNGNDVHETSRVSFPEWYICPSY